MLVLLGWAVVGLRLRGELLIRLSRTFFVYVRFRGSAELYIPIIIKPIMKSFKHLMHTACLLLMGTMALAFTSCSDDDDNDKDNLRGYEAVDLGLSVKWAACNVGADMPQGFGGYYSWGETEEKEAYTLDSYVDPNPQGNAMDISGTEYDVAHVKWGGSWRMPTYDEFSELIRSCTWEWVIMEGDVAGYKVTGPNGNSIFLPAAGHKSLYHGDYTPVRKTNETGCYKTSTDKGDGPCYVIFGDSYVSSNGEGRAFYGESIRPVTN